MDYEYTGEKLWYHKVLIDILEYVVPILEQNDIAYWLFAGTALGAVRNHKIIPWDYDIDACVLCNEKRIAEIFSKNKNDFSIQVESTAIRVFYSLSNKILSEEHKNILKLDEGASNTVKLFGEYLTFYPMHVDIFPCFIDNSMVRRPYNPTHFIPLTEIENLVKIEFEGKMYNFSHPPESDLIRLFGENFIKPKIDGENVKYIQRFDPNNKDIFTEIERYKHV